MVSVFKTKEAMVERCLIAASLAALVCHPSSTIKCFKPKPRSPEEDNLKDSKRHYSSPPKDQKRLFKEEEVVVLPSKPQKNLHTYHASSSSSERKKKKKPIKAFSELVEKDRPSVGIVESIVRSGWVSSDVGLKIEKVLRVNHSKNVLRSFEEYREDVKATHKKGRILKKIERLVVDGNELLQFHGATVACSLGINGDTRICKMKCCQVCRMITSGFSGNDGTMSFFGTSWRAHQKVNRECLKKRVCARKAMVICRVISGRIAHFHAHGLMDNDGGEFDSVMAWTGDQFSDSRELLILNSEAVLPCFVIIYKVEKPS
ncbi:putative poly(ADP-ribose) polymerase, catalytic domain-containing protein [Rosa chinensis]|uniref:Putative poly(ADP-ribose) polymerase, catalytic domain-containing protein n=1 Tax=Rosa chinensis TaxID=74649 RepID=A0A2P6RAL1_ROSCH|nr:putative poly(ADP-ribose) polymerase, catalytic domain-containing protein [Rosa chinensis]